MIPLLLITLLFSGCAITTHCSNGVCTDIYYDHAVDRGKEIIYISKGRTEDLRKAPIINYDTIKGTIIQPQTKEN